MAEQDEARAWCVQRHDADDGQIEYEIFNPYVGARFIAQGDDAKLWAHKVCNFLISKPTEKNDAK